MTRQNRRLARQHEELLPHRLLQLRQTARYMPPTPLLRVVAAAHAVAQQRIAGEEEVAEAVADRAGSVSRRRNDGSLHVSTDTQPHLVTSNIDRLLVFHVVEINLHEKRQERVLRLRAPDPKSAPCRVAASRPPPRKWGCFRSCAESP